MPLKYKHDSLKCVVDFHIKKKKKNHEMLLLKQFIEQVNEKVQRHITCPINSNSRVPFQ